MPILRGALAEIRVKQWLGDRSPVDRVLGRGGGIATPYAMLTTDGTR